MENKILLFEDLISKIEKFKKEGKIVVQSHGVFDLIHPGLIKHLNLAKQQGDILIVTVIKDKDVRRGPGRPIFHENFRAENVASLMQVDYVCIVDDGIPFDCVNKIKPDVFAKGQTYKERDGRIHKKIFEEEKELYFGKSRIHETNGFSFSSSEIINNFLNIYPKEVKLFLKSFAKRYSFQYILEKINGLQDLRVLLLGDGIVDEYHYCESLGKSVKSHLIVNKYLTHEVFAGGVFAIANHIAGLCKDVQLISLLGIGDTKQDFISSNIRPNVKIKFFYREDGPTIVKKRYINQYLNQKLFEINYLNDNYINENLESEVINYLGDIISSYDVILISDFGHGFITKKIIEFIKKRSIRYAVNTQTNGANAGYNMITKYEKPMYACLDETEARLSAQDRYGDIEKIAKTVAETINSDFFIVTRGKNGSLGIIKGSEINRTPAFSGRVIDTVGAGDAFFAFTAPCMAQGLPFDFVCFIGNAVGAIAVQIVGNKKPVEKYELLEFVHTLLK